MKKLTLYCTCGAVWMHNDEKGVDQGVARRIWSELHHGPGHKPCDAKAAARARAKAERENVKEAK